MYFDFDSFFEATCLNGAKLVSGGVAQDAPDDLLDYKDKFEISIELPGVNKKDVDIQFEKDILRVKALKERTYDKDDVNRLTSYRNYNNIEKTYKIPSAVDRNKITADCKDGILTIVLPKTAEAKPKKISVG